MRWPVYLSFLLPLWCNLSVSLSHLSIFFTESWMPFLVCGGITGNFDFLCCDFVTVLGFWGKCARSRMAEWHGSVQTSPHFCCPRGQMSMIRFLFFGIMFSYVVYLWLSLAQFVCLMCRRTHSYSDILINIITRLLAYSKP